MTLSQAELVVVRYLEDHPAELHKGDAGPAYDAFKKAFPSFETLTDSADAP